MFSCTFILVFSLAFSDEHVALILYHVDGNHLVPAAYIQRQGLQNELSVIVINEGDQ